MKLSIIQRTLTELGVKPSKSLGQNFLHDQNLAQWIVAQLELQSGNHLVEIGPGLGALTEYALDRCGSATLIEKDARLAEFLKERFAGKRVEILHCDAIDFDVRALFPRAPVKVLGNLPYYISSQVLFKFTAEPSPAERLVFTLQRELAERLSAQPATKDYGALTVIVGRCWRVKLLRTLPAGVFVPAPKVDSAVVLLTPREPGELPDCDGEFFNALVKQGFSQRRKQLRKLLCARDLPGADAVERPIVRPASSAGVAERASVWPVLAKQIAVPETARAEELGIEQWIALTNLIRPCAASAAQDVHGEMFPVVDENDRVVRSASRHEVHTQKLMHRAVHVFVFNRAGELFLQKRSRWKDAHPSKWDSSTAGHVNFGHDYDETASREIEEELGVRAHPEPVAKIGASERTGFEFVHLYRAAHDGPFKLARSEIECGCFFPLPLIREWISARPSDFASGFLECFAVFDATMRGREK
jgi:16S rRNA (adenine1518-N6/adenine1519-N6)-dimethyltransferase